MSRQWMQGFVAAIAISLGAFVCEANGVGGAVPGFALAPGSVFAPFARAWAGPAGGYLVFFAVNIFVWWIGITALIVVFRRLYL